MIDDNLILEILETVTFYTDQTNPTTTYVEYVDTRGVKQFVKSTDKEFRVFLRHTYRLKADTLIAPPLDGYLEAFLDAAIAQKNDTATTAHRRLSGSLQKRIFYFLANDKRQIVAIKKTGWKIGSTSRVHFLQSPSDLPQVTPISGGNLLKLLRPYVNLHNDDFLLFVVYLVQCYSQSDHFIAILSGQQGTGKSTLSKIIRALIDPSEIDINKLPNTQNDLINLLANNFLVCFDNSQRFSESVSDLLCAAVTGVTSSKRQLYTDADQIVLHLHNTVVVNGISVIPKKSDFAERALLFELEKIPTCKRSSSNAYWANFEKDKPAILGAIFDTLSKAIEILPSLHPTNLHRMADAHLEMLAIAAALGMDQKTFESLLSKNNKKLNSAYADQNPLAEALVNFMGSRSKVSGATTEIYNDIYASILGDKRFFPKSPSALTRKLNEEKSAIESVGLRVTQGKTKKANTLTISRIPKNQQKK